MGPSIAVASPRRRRARLALAPAVLLALFLAGFGPLSSAAYAAEGKTELNALAMRMLAAFLDAPEPGPGVVDEDLSRRGFAEIFAAANKADLERIGKRIAPIDTAIWGKPSADGRFDPDKPPAGLVILAYLGDWARERYAPLVRAALDAPDLEPSNDLNLFEFPSVEGLSLHMAYRTPYDRETRRPGTWRAPSTSVTLTAFSGALAEAQKAFDRVVCGGVADGKPFQRSGGSKMHELTESVWRSLPFCQKDMYYANETARDSNVYVAHWRSSHSILLKDFKAILTVVKNGPLIANPERQLFDLKNMPARMGATNSAAADARRLLAALETDGAHDIVGYLRGDGVPPVAGLDDAAIDARAGQVAKAARDWAAANRISLRHRKSVPIYGRQMAHFLALEEGVGPILRSGAEIAFYETLKRRAAAAGSDTRPLNYGDLIVMGLEVARRDGDRIFLDDVYLTIHNVVRLLARPEQWTPVPEGDANVRRDAIALAIIRDIQGVKPTGGGLTLLDIVDERAPAGTMPRFAARHSRAGELMDDNYTVPQLFGRETGIFQFQPNVRNAHWNAGCHYYFWVGALGHHFGDDVAVEIAHWREKAAKDAGNEHDRAVVQLSHMEAGGRVDELLKDVTHIEDLKDNPD